MSRDERRSTAAGGGGGVGDGSGEGGGGRRRAGGGGGGGGGHHSIRLRQSVVVMDGDPKGPRGDRAASPRKEVESSEHLKGSAFTVVLLTNHHHLRQL